MGSCAIVQPGNTSPRHKETNISPFSQVCKRAQHRDVWVKGVTFTTYTIRFHALTADQYGRTHVTTQHEMSDANDKRTSNGGPCSFKLRWRQIERHKKNPAISLSFSLNKCFKNPSALHKFPRHSFQNILTRTDSNKFRVVFQYQNKFPNASTTTVHSHCALSVISSICCLLIIKEFFNIFLQ
jgi:DNA-binding XRE family transcriptional regulator